MLKYYIGHTVKTVPKDKISLAISLIVNITLENPRTYPICCRIISILINKFNNGEEKYDIIKRIRNKFLSKINYDYMEIWLQRLSLKIKPGEEYGNELCQLVSRNKMDLWNLKWLQNGIKEDGNEKAESRENKKNESKDSHVAKILLQIMNSTPLVNRETIDRMPPVIQSTEVDAFDEYG